MSETRTAGYATTEELRMIRDSIMLPYMLTMADKARQDIDRSEHMFRRHYAGMTRLIMDKITADLAELRRELRMRKIKVDEDGSSDGILYWKYFCRGYEERFGIVRETLRSEIAFRMGEYGDKVFHELAEVKSN